MQLQELYVKFSLRFNRVPMHEILFVESAGHYCRIHTTANKTHIVRRRMAELAGKLPGDAFMRIHKRYIIGRIHIQFFEGYSVQVNDTRVPIGRAYYDKLLEQMVVV